ncbi:hypothetical protein [Achromobacter xylosoxidans]|uniref:hypothetical protein n=1 Tax=Alcaligenes xylosoxydans xylosoxydans TaxID=85698 RepID=UPI000760C926|nr:hypothetical protein [Achromobacter xylosoxidans]KWU16239.1 hypothetical protein AS148_25070 [Achromobacter xylosoxidans]
MQTFKDTETGEFYRFDDDVRIEETPAGRQFYAPYGALLTVPATLVPASLDDMPVPPPPDPVPVSRYQGREAMRLTPYPKEGKPDWTLFDAFEELLNDPTTPAYYRRAWDELQAFEWGSAMLHAAADVLGLTLAQRLDLFALAATLKA